MNAYDASSNLIFHALARSFQPTYTFTVTSVSKASPAVVTITAHGLQTDNLVTISGATGDWAGLNGDQKITAVDADTFTVAINTSAYSGSFNGTITTNAPRTSANCWFIQQNYFDTNRLTRTASAGGSVAADKAWDSRTTYTYL